MTTVSTKRAVPERVNGELYSVRLIEGKLAVPHAVFRVLHRTRLVSLLDRTTAHRVTLVAAPAGSGKTTACASWAADRAQGARIGWLSLDSADNDPARFRSYLLAALRRAQPLLGEPVAGEAVPGQAVPGQAVPGQAVPGQAVPGQAVPGQAVRGVDPSAPGDFPLPLIKAAERLAEPLVLILDDAHELTGACVLGWLDQLIRYAPPMLRVVLSCRRTPALQLARLRVSGELAVVDAADLACTPEEAQAYFAMLGLEAAPDDQRELLRHTEGWMAGIRLAALRSQARPGGANIADISGDDPMVTDYLRDEVLAGKDPQIRAFLLRTSIVQHLTGKLADALTNTTGGAGCLDQLSRENSFVQALDGERTWYRYHPLLRELLVAELRRQVPHEVPVLQRRAARWYARHGRPVDALRSCAQARDRDYAAQVLAASDITILMSHGPAELERMLAQIPPDLAIDDVAIGAAFAAARLWADDPDGAQAHLDGAGAGLGRAAAPMRQIMEPKLAALRVMQDIARGCVDESLLAQARERAEQGAQSSGTRDGHRALGVLWWSLGMAHLRRSELPQARLALRRADRELGGGDFTQLQARARMWWALAEAWQGNLAAAEAAAVGVLNAEPPPTAATRHIGRLALALVSLMRDELQAAHRLLDQLDYSEHSRMPGEPSLVLSANLIRARTLIAEGDTCRAKAILGQLRDKPGAAGTELTGAITLLEGEIALRAGDSELGARVSRRLNAGPGAAVQPGGRFMLARLLLASADPHAALRAVEPYLAEPGGDDAKLHEWIGALLVAAVAHRRLKTPERAAALLEQALLLAEPENARRVFVDGGPAVRSALTVLVSPASRSAGFAGKILQRLDAQLPAGSGSSGDDALPLSDSELAVLRFLPSHLTNEEIGEALFLSVNTVKTHLRSAYRKLGVRSRREAIALARRRGLVVLSSRAHPPQTGRSAKIRWRALSRFPVPAWPPAGFRAPPSPGRRRYRARPCATPRR